MNKVEFISEEWIEVVAEEAARLVAAQPNAAAAPPFVFIEVYRNAPAPRSDGFLNGYRLEIINGVVSLRSGARLDESFDLRITIDYFCGCELVKWKTGAESERLVENAVKSGALVFEGSADGAPFDMAKLHDIVSDRTLHD